MHGVSLTFGPGKLAEMDGLGLVFDPIDSRGYKEFDPPSLEK